MKSKSTITILLVLLMVCSILTVDTAPTRSTINPSQIVPQEINTMSEAPSISPPHILVYTEYANQSAGAELENTMNAINNTYGTDYQMTALVNWTLLDSLLPGKDILLIPEQGSANSDS
jgi:hypothetical protein